MTSATHRTARRFANRKLLLVLFAVIALATVACEPTRAAFEITNDSGRAVDFIYAEDFIDLRDFGRNYDAIGIGDRDTYQGCTVCDLAPGGVHRFEEPFSNGQSVVMVARAADSDELIFKRRFTWQELLDLEWAVSIVDQTGE